MSTKSTFTLDDQTLNELEKLKQTLGESKSKIVRDAVEDYYIKEKRASQKFEFFLDLYNEGLIDEEQLHLLLPEKDAESIIIGSRTGKEAAELVK